MCFKIVSATVSCDLRVQKEGLNFDRLVEEVKLRMGRYNCEPNLLIVPPQLSLYLSMVPDEKIKCVSIRSHPHTCLHTSGLH